VAVEPRVVEVGMFYRGTQLRVEGVAPAGYRLAVVCVGEEARVELRRKGKVWNVLWRNVGSIAFERVPSLYLASPELDGEQGDGAAPTSERRLGAIWQAVEARSLPAQADEDTRRLFRDLIRLKIEERLYGVGTLRPESSPDEAGPIRVAAEFELPASTPPGTYQVRMIGTRDGATRLLASEEIVVRRVGLALLIADLARRHGFLYGVFSVVLAMSAGALTGILFAGARKGH
jgi:hypothetical protein